MRYFQVRLDLNIKPELENWKSDIRKKLGIEVSNGKAIALLLGSPKVVMLNASSKKRKLEIKSF